MESSFDDDSDPGLARSTTIPSFAIPSDVGFVGFDIALQERSGERCETRSKLVKQRPGRLIAPQAGVPLELESGDPLLVTSNEEYSQKPHPKWYTGSMENGPCSDRTLIPTLPALF
jgi:hypothetical protein